MHNFFTELKRRKVFRVAVVYAATAFVVLQAASLLASGLALPAWVFTAITVLTIVGFPIALVLAWALEITPDGVRRAETAPTPGEQPALEAQAAAGGGQRSGIGPRTAVAAVALTSLGLVMGWLMRPAVDAASGGARDAASVTARDAGSITARDAGSVTARDAAYATPGDAAYATATPEAASVAAQPSLAVLPLENVGGDPEHAAFAIGLHDDLLTQLSKIDGLRLTSRTSVREYAQTTKNIRDIAAELGVRHILEGSVQRVEQQVRINVQLIEATTDRHLWAQTYDKDLTVANLFAIQAEIAGAIAQALQVELTGEAREDIARPPTENLAAYDAYLRGLAGGFWDADSSAAEAFAEAGRLDPSFAAAFAGEARSRTWLSRLAFQTGEIPAGRRMAARARAAAARAVALAPDAGETKLAEGYVSYYVDWDLEQALARFREVEALRPDDPGVLIACGLVLRRLGRWYEALAEFERAVRIDGRNVLPVYELAQTYLHMGRFDESLRYSLIAFELNPGLTDAVEIIVQSYAGMGDTTGIRRFLEDESPAVTEQIADRWLLVPLGREAMERRLAVILQNRERRSPATVYVAAASWADRLGRRDLRSAFADSLLTLLRPGLDALDDSADPRIRSAQHRLAGLAFAYRGRAGDAEQAVRHARRAVELTPCELDAIECHSSRETLLEVLIVTGHLDEVVEEGPELLRPPTTWSARRLRTDPLAEPLRGHPEFQRLLAEATP